MIVVLFKVCVCAFQESAVTIMGKDFAAIMSLQSFLSNRRLFVGFFSCKDVYSILIVEWPEQL